MSGNKLPELELTGNKRENFRLWRTRFDDYCIIAGYRDAAKDQNTDKGNHYKKDKRPLEIATFRSALPNEALKIVQLTIEPALNAEDIKKPWKWMEALSQHFVGADTVMSDRYTFHEIKQQESETMTDWEIRVQEMAAPLEYGEMADQMKRDKFTFGLYNSNIRGELLKMNHKDKDGNVLKLSHVTSQAKALEAAETANKMVDTSSREEINWVKRNNPTIHKQQQCWYCGEQNRHSWQNCPAYGQICTTCGGANHFAKMCRATLPRSNLRAERPNPTKQINQRNMRSNRYSQQPSMYNHHNRNQYNQRHVHQISNSEDFMSEEDANSDLFFDPSIANEDSDGYSQAYSLEVRAISSVSNPAPGKKYYAILPLLERGNKFTNIKCQIDTAASVNTMPESVLHLISPNPQIRKTNAQLHPYSGPPIKPVGTVELCCELRGHYETLTFYVVPSDAISPKPPLLSGSDCVKLGLVSIKADVIHQIDMKRESKEKELPLPQKTLTKEWILEHFKPQFTGIGDMGEVSFDLDPTIKPIQAPPHRIPFSKRKAEKETLEKYVKDGILTKVDEPTPWISNMVIRQTPNKTRLCLDPSQTLNKAIRRPKYQIPTLEEQLPKLKDAKCFSIVDVNLGFTNMRLDQESSMMTTMHTSFGRYRWLRFPFGIASGTEEYQNRQHQAIEGLENVINIADDILIYGTGRNYEEASADHDKHFLALLQRYKQRNLKLNPRKLQFKLKQVKFMGHILTDNGIKADPDKITAIKNMPTPLSKKALQRYLGMVQYLAKFCPQLSSIVKPLRLLTHDDSKFVWSEIHQEALEQSKALITRSPTLQYYDSEKPVVLQVDASEDGLGGALLQEDSNNNLQPVAYTSCSLNQTEINYAQIEKECLAICAAFNKWDQWLYGQYNITVHSDHQPLETIFKRPLNKAPRRLQKMIMRLQRYHFKVIYKKGSSLHIADTLSRAALPTPTNYDLSGFEVFRMDLISSETERNLGLQPTTENKLRIETQKDSTLQALTEMIRNGWPDSKSQIDPLVRPYWEERDILTIINGIVYKGAKAIIPRSMYSDMLHRIHKNHMGPESNIRMAREVLYWPGMRGSIQDMCESCSECAQYQKQEHTEPMKSLPVPSLPWQLVSQDIFQHGSAHYLITVDHYSDFIEVDELPDTSSKTVINRTKQHFARHGIPQRVHSDNGPQFISTEYAHFAQKYNFEHTTSSPYWPRGNGKAEAAVKIVKNMLQKSDDIHLALLNHRNTPPKGHDYSPAQRLMSRRTQTLVPTSDHLLTPDSIEPNQIKQQIIQKKLISKDQYDKKHNTFQRELPPLSHGQYVYAKPPPHKRGTA